MWKQRSFRTILGLLFLLAELNCVTKPRPVERYTVKGTSAVPVLDENKPWVQFESQYRWIEDLARAVPLTVYRSTGRKLFITSLLFLLNIYEKTIDR